MMELLKKYPQFGFCINKRKELGYENPDIFSPASDQHYVRVSMCERYGAQGLLSKLSHNLKRFGKRRTL